MKNPELSLKSHRVSAVCLFSFMAPQKQLVGATFDGTVAGYNDRPLGLQGDNHFILIVSKCAMTAGVTNNVNI